MSKDLRAYIMSAAVFIVVTVVMCLTASFMMRAGDSQTPGDDSSDVVSAVTPQPDQNPEGPSPAVDDEPLDTPTPEPTLEPTQAPEKQLIVIDAGHQKTANNEREPIGPGSDQTRTKVTSGTTGVSSRVPEYELTLTIALQLEEALLQKGYDVLMIRRDHEVDISDSQRAITANESGAAIVLHIHANADERSNIKGIMAFVPSQNNPFSSAYSEQSTAAAQSILEEMEKTTGARNWGVINNDSLSTLNYTTIPAVHIEVGYMTNAEEDAQLMQADYQTRIVEGIADGVSIYLQESN